MSRRLNREEGGRRGLAVALTIALLSGSFCPSAFAESNATEEALTMNDFSVGRSLVASSPGGLQSVLLDFEVYARSIEPELADIRVFDAQGRPVPYALRRRYPYPEKRPSKAFEAVPIFKIARDASGSDGAGSGAYRIDAELSPKGAIVQIHPGIGREGTRSERFAWLVDVSRIKSPVVSLEFEFEASAEDLVANFRVEASDDLANWRTHRSDVVVARLAQSGHSIERMRFDVPAIGAKYLRLTPVGDPSLPALSGIQVQPSSVPKPIQMSKNLKVIPGVIDPEDPQVVLFDLAGAPSIETVRLLLTEPGSLIEGQLESAQESEGPWSRRAQGIFYHYEEKGFPIRSRKLDWDGRRDRYIRFKASSRGGGLLGQVPQLEIAWVPDQLLYLDRGDGDSTLAIGRLGAGKASFAPQQLLKTLQGGEVKFHESTGVLGAERVLAGASALEPPPEPIPWRTYGLWGVLVGGVAIVLLLGLRLMRAGDVGAGEGS